MPKRANKPYTGLKLSHPRGSYNRSFGSRTKFRDLDLFTPLMTTKITIVFRHKGLHQPLMTPQSHCNNERSQFSASVPPIETSQFLFPTHFVADVRFFTPDPWIRSMDLIPGSDPWIRSMDQIHGSDPWIRSMDLIHGSEQKAGQNRLAYLVCAW